MCYSFPPLSGHHFGVPLGERTHGFHRLQIFQKRLTLNIVFIGRKNAFAVESLQFAQRICGLGRYAAVCGFRDLCLLRNDRKKFCHFFIVQFKDALMTSGKSAGNNRVILFTRCRYSGCCPNGSSDGVEQKPDGPAQNGPSGGRGQCPLFFALRIFHRRSSFRRLNVVLRRNTWPA